jgi:hypothetical protein
LLSALPEPFAPKANGVDVEGLAGSGAFAPNPPNGLPAGVVEPADCPKANPVDLFSATGVAGAPNIGAALADSAAGVLLAPNENVVFGASAGLAVGADCPKANGVDEEPAAGGAGEEAAG